MPARARDSLLGLEARAAPNSLRAHAERQTFFRWLPLHPQGLTFPPPIRTAEGLRDGMNLRRGEDGVNPEEPSGSD